VHEYLPLFFSRRHGDPSRPWNRFSITVKDEKGNRARGYEGNWRDIFQNWEALCHSFPEFCESMICRFVNTSTADGYNPYRITNAGYEWEVPAPDEPWANIGYWGDHQLIYLLKLLEFSRSHHPAWLNRFLAEDIFVYADVPYDIKPYAELLQDPKASIDYSTVREQEIASRRAEVGSDGSYAVDQTGDICRANLTEKLLVPLLAKVSNFIPGAGFWMNTQRPEWNDANNALAGYGVSMVTLYYARRYVAFFRELLEGAGLEEVRLNLEVAWLFSAVRRALEDNRSLIAAAEISDADRKNLLDRLGEAAEEHRYTVYRRGFAGRREAVAVDELLGFLDLLLRFFDQTIQMNLRPDGLYHAYNVMTATADGIAVGRLQEMLEGQVAVLSSGSLEPDECVSVLTALRNSAMYRDDQHSYTLYPNRVLPSFFAKNTLSPEHVESSRLIRELLEHGNQELVVQDVEGAVHFNGAFRNVLDVVNALDRLSETGFAGLADAERDLTSHIFESVFQHREFTGRSGTFYGYEGLGCIYWHMVSKLLLATCECCQAAPDSRNGVSRELVGSYFDIRSGLGFNKAPEIYGAFPTDPYSHTPGHTGARQPGMTGQVKEEIIARWVELGLVVRDGQFCIDPLLVRHREFLAQSTLFEYVDASDRWKSLELELGTLAFTKCQTLFVVHAASEERFVVHWSDGTQQEIHGAALGRKLSREIFQRTGNVVRVDVFLRPFDAAGETA
jgi:hypothetical protein